MYSFVRACRHLARAGKRGAKKRKDAFADEEEADEEFADDDSFEDSEAVSQESDDSNVAVEQLSQGTKKDAGAVPDVAETQKESRTAPKVRQGYADAGKSGCENRTGAGRGAGAYS